jgi:hypothetical protein
MLRHNNKIHFSLSSTTISCSTITIIFTDAGVANLLWETVNLKLVIYIGNRTNIRGGKKAVKQLDCLQICTLFSHAEVCLPNTALERNTKYLSMYVLGRHQYVRCNPSINVAPAHSMNNLNTLALDRVPFIQRKSVNSKGLLHLYFQILIKTWKPFRRHTPAEVFPTTHTHGKGMLVWKTYKITGRYHCSYKRRIAWLTGWVGNEAVMRE